MFKLSYLQKVYSCCPSFSIWQSRLHLKYENLPLHSQLNVQFYRFLHLSKKLCTASVKAVGSEPGKHKACLEHQLSAGNTDYCVLPLAAANLYTSRTHTCGELSKENAGQRVTIMGWMMFKRFGGKILVIRDAYGQTQAIIPENVCQVFFYFEIFSSTISDFLGTRTHRHCHESSARVGSECFRDSGTEATKSA